MAVCPVIKAHASRSSFPAETAARVKPALAARDRAKGGPAAPAEGLYLVGVTY